MSERRYLVNEIFLSPQGEGKRAGSLNVFVRFSKCNMACDVAPGPKSPGGFACDTEFESGRRMSDHDIVAECALLWPRYRDKDKARGEPWVICTGGEPLLQLDLALCDALHSADFKIAVETNGSLPVPYCGIFGIDDEEIEPKWQMLVSCGDTPEEATRKVLRIFAVDWITVSPKVAEHAVRQKWAHEVKYVRGHGQGLPRPACRALHRLISPAFNGLQVDERAAAWCVQLVRENPEWELSAQLHKLWTKEGVR